MSHLGSPRSERSTGRRSRAARFLALIVAGILMALGSITTASAQTQPSLTVGYYDNPPLVYQDPDGNPAGLMPDVLDAISDEEGWEIEYRFYDWADGLAALESGEIDAYGVIAYTQERDDLFDFTSETLYSNWAQVVVAEGDVDSFESILDMDGKWVAVLDGDIHFTGAQGVMNLARDFGIDPAYRVVDSYSEVIDAVVAGQADAGVVNRLVASTDARAAGLSQSTIVFNPVEVRIAFTTERDFSRQIETIDEHLSAWIEDPDSPYHASLEANFPALTQRALPPWLLPSALGIGALALVLAATTLYLRWQVRARTRELQDSNARLEALLGNIPEAVFVIDAQDRVEYFKPAPGFDSALPAEAMLGRTFSEIPLEPEVAEAVAPAVKAARESGDIVNVEYPRKVPGEPTQYFTAAMKATRNLDVVVAVREVTGRHLEQLTLEQRGNELESLVNERSEKLVAANLELEAANRAKTVFLARVSHELRTPLNSVIGFSKVLMQGMAGELNAEQARQVEMINRAGENLLSLVNEVLDLSRLESGGLQPEPTGFSLEFLIEETVNEFKPAAEEKGLTIQSDTRDAPETIYTDRRMIQQVLRNLIDNAVKFTDVGSVHIDVHAGKADTVIAEITDTGPGMTPMQSEHIFELFYRATPESSRIAGFGVGLAICDRLIRLLRGKIDFASVPGEGTTFRVMLPRVLGEGVAPSRD